MNPYFPIGIKKAFKITYGSAEIDGHAFCLGLDSISTDLEESMIQATFLT